MINNRIKLAKTKLNKITIFIWCRNLLRDYDSGFRIVKRFVIHSRNLSIDHHLKKERLKSCLWCQIQGDDDPWMNPLKRESRETFDAFVNIPIFIIFQLRLRNFSFHHLSTLALIADLSKHICAPPLFSYGTDSKIGIKLTSKKYF